MQCQMGYVKNHNQLLIKDIDLVNKTLSNKVIGVEELSNQTLSVLFYDDEMIEDESLKDLLRSDSKFYPMREAKELNLTSESFEKLDSEQASQLLDKVINNWTLQNNVTLLEEMFTIVDHLNGLWPNDRTAFFEELWFIFKNNLGAQNVKLIYNDLKKIGKNEDKNTLIQVMIQGDKVPNPSEGKELEKKLMESYKDEFIEKFNVTEYSPEKSQLVLAGNIKKSPFLLMVNTTQFTRLQSSILNAFITALSR